MIIKDYFKNPKLFVAISDIRDGNMSFVWGQSKEVVESRKKFFKKIKIDPKNVVWNHNVLGDRIDVVFSKDRGRGVFDLKTSPENDGFITTEKDLYLATVVADCQVVLFYDPKKEVIAIVHAGRPGVEQGIVPKVIKILTKKFGSKPKDIQIAISPAIKKCCYKFERIDKSLDKKWLDYIEEKDGLYEIDASKRTLDQIKDAGVNTKNVIVDKTCTCCNKNYFSHYRDVTLLKQKDKGRFAVIFGMKK